MRAYTRLYRRPQPGDIIRMRWHAWRVETVTDLAPEDGDTITDPYRIEVIPLTGSEEATPHAGDVRKHVTWQILDEHFPVCHRCGEVPPCRESEEERYAAEQSRKFDEALRIPDGACPACSEPITTRQKTHHFSGPNLDNPLASDGVVFHARRRCAGSAARYEERWVRAGLGERSLLTLRCSGTVTVHGDGTGECHGRTDGEDCPTIYAYHRGAAACYISSHGCGQGCTPAGHPGMRLAPDLTPHGYRPKETP